MGDLPSSRTERSLERVWKQLTEAFDDAVKDGGYVSAPDLTEIIQYDFPLRKDQPVGKGIPILDRDPQELSILSQLDDTDADALDEAKDLLASIKRVALHIRCQLIESLAAEVIKAAAHNNTAPGWDEACWQMKQTLKDENGVLWLNGPSYDGLDRWLETHPNALPKVTRRRMNRFHDDSNMLLFPVEQRLINRQEIFPLELGWEPSGKPGTVYLHSWHHYELHVDGAAKSMIINWRSLPDKMLVKADESGDEVGS